MFVQRELREIETALDLPDTTLVVIGLWNMGYTDLAFVAHVLWITDTEPLEKLYVMLHSTQDPLIRRFVDDGLPPGVYGSLALKPGRFGVDEKESEDREVRGVKCLLCGAKVSMVPCPACSTRHPDGPLPPYKYRTDPHPMPHWPTDAPPGSAEKVHVLATRRALGLSLWNPQDRPLTQEQ